MHGTHLLTVAMVSACLCVPACDGRATVKEPDVGVVGDAGGCDGSTDSLVVLTDRGIAHAKQGRFAEAEQCLRPVSDRSDGSVQWMNLGSTYLDWATALIGEGKPDEAKRRLEQSTDAFEAALRAPDGPPPAELHRLLAGNYYNLEHHGKAVAQLERLLLRSDATPADRKQAHEMLDIFVREPAPTITAEESAAHDEAFRKASELVSPSMVLAGTTPEPVNRAKVVEAIGLLESALRHDPRNWAAYWILGKAHQALEDKPAAHDAFKRAAEIHPYHPDVAREQCLALLALDRAAEAVTVAQRAVNYNPEDPGLVANLALAQLLHGDVAAAEQNASKALAAAPDDPVTGTLVKLIADVKAGTTARPTTLDTAGGAAK